MRFEGSKTTAAALVTVAMALGVTARGEEAPRGLTAVAGIKVGHFTLAERLTGCTAILAEAGATAAVDVRGGAPGTRETDLLDPRNSVQKVHAIVLSGGSAFGLDAATGVVRYLEEKGVGFDVGIAKVPIVPSAILYDLPVGGKPSVRPTADCGYRAAKAATTGPVAEGNVGAGAGATVGKSAGAARAMKGGIGTASITTADGLVVAALVAVNAIGDIVDPATGRVVAGVRTADGKGLADARTLVRAGVFGSDGPAAPRPMENTTLGVVATNAALTKAQAQKVAQMAHDGFARAISPSHTAWDGDTIFALATGAHSGNASAERVGALAAEVMADAILRAASQAAGIPGYPAARDLTPAR
jgi:L-aminopeptidase/D-esterase-like protein